MENCSYHEGHHVLDLPKRLGWTHKMVESQCWHGRNFSMSHAKGLGAIAGDLRF